MFDFPRILHTPLARGGLYITAVWIRQAKELNMKRLLGLTLFESDPAVIEARSLDQIDRVRNCSW